MASKTERVKTDGMAKHKARKNVPELPLVGDVDDWEADTIRALIEIPEGGACVFHIDSAGGSVYSALAVVTLLRLRRLMNLEHSLGHDFGRSAGIDI